MEAILLACDTGGVDADCVTVVSPKSGSHATDLAIQHGVPVEIVEPTDEDFASNLLSHFQTMRVDLVCLAGFTRLVPSEVVRAYPDAMLNIHPALLPKFGGQGFYGMRVHEAVLAAGESETGCTVHFVSERYDEGRILLQMRCPVVASDTPETLSARVLALEHVCYVEAIRLWIEQHHQSLNASR
jgi:formyltetrahydrofolate-dependent phosphoribosylglycinamide formyltransferase